MCWCAISPGRGGWRGCRSLRRTGRARSRAIASCCQQAGVNIIEINHSRIFTRLPAKDTVIEVECEARDPEAIEHCIQLLQERRFQGRSRLSGLIFVNIATFPLRDIAEALTLFSGGQTLFNGVYQSHKVLRNHLGGESA